MGILRIVKMEFEPASVHSFDRLFHLNQGKILAMPGCQQVILLNGSSHDAVRTTLSWWKDQAALDDYRHSELFGIVWPQTKKMFVSEPVAWSLDWPLDLADSLPFPL